MRDALANPPDRSKLSWRMPARHDLTARHRYKQVLPPRCFPSEEKVSESPEHRHLRFVLADSLELELKVPGRANVGSNEFVYWNARDPRRCLSPDVFVRRGPMVPTSRKSWKTWQHGGVPDLAVEITSQSDTPRHTWEEKLERYAELGVPELVRFSIEAPPEARLQVWDRIDENLLEREVRAHAEWCESLGLWWVVLPDPDTGVALRLARDPAGQDVLPTREEHERRAKEDALRAQEQALRGQEEERRAKEQALRGQEEERRAREAAEARIRELEAELLRRGG